MMRLEVVPIYTWVAQYRDGSTASEKDVGSFRHVDAAAVETVWLRPQRKGLPEVAVVVPEGSAAACWRHHEIIIDVTGQRSTQHNVLTCAGWQDGDAVTYVAVNDTGQVTLAKAKSG